MRASRRRALIGAAAAVPTALLAVPAAPAAAAPAATAPPPPPPTPTKAGEPSQYCSTVMLTREQLDAHMVSTVQCFDTYDESLRAVGIDPSSTTRTTSDGATTNGVVVLAEHYEDPYGQTFPLSISGTLPCNGGGVQFPAGSAWNDRIQSTAPRACSTVKHWTEPDFNGSMDTASGRGTTRTLQNGLGKKVSSIKYYDS